MQRSLKTHLMTWALAATLAPSAFAQIELPPECPSAAPPYVFVLMDTSGSMNRRSICTAADVAAGFCGPLCTSGNCRTDLQADDPLSKLYFAKAGLYDAIEAEPDVRLGFGSFNLDALKVRGKHWLYGALSNGPSIPGFGPFPAVGNQEVFGATWACDNGTGDSEVGCYSTTPADTNDTWELERVRHLPKGGASLTTTVTTYLRVPGGLGTIYRLVYTPVSGSLGGSSITMRVTTSRCSTSTCVSSTQIGVQNVTFQKLLDYLSWDNGGTSSQQRTDPEQTFFPQSVASDASATNACSGWDPNTDSTVDATLGYNLRFPTVVDPRGTFLDRGDVVPFDWLDDNRQAIERRLAPNLSSASEPDFGVARYLNDQPIAGQTYLRLTNEVARPLIAVGTTPIGASLLSFYGWFTGCPSGFCSTDTGWASLAAANDPDYLCRRKAVILLTDGADTCSNVDPKVIADYLYLQRGVLVYVVGLDAPSPQTGLDPLALHGGTLAARYANHRAALATTLGGIFDELMAPPSVP